MTLTQRLTEFRFNLETLDMLSSMGRNTAQVGETMSQLGFNNTLVNFMTSQRALLTSVLVRLQLYSEQNYNETKVRSGLAMLSNSGVNSLLDYLFMHTHNEQPVSTVPVSTVPVSTPVSAPVSVPVRVKQEVKPEDEQDEPEDEQDEETSYFDDFFERCVRVSDDGSITMKQMYEAFTKWWVDESDDEAPTKDELKEYLSQRLGRQIKSTITNVALA